MDAWMYDVVSAVRVTAPNDSLSSPSPSVSLFRPSCAISWLCLRDAHVALRHNLSVLSLAFGVVNGRESSRSLKGQSNSSFCQCVTLLRARKILRDRRRRLAIIDAIKRVIFPITPFKNQGVSPSKSSFARIVWIIFFTLTFQQVCERVLLKPEPSSVSRRLVTLHNVSSC